MTDSRRCVQKAGDDTTIWRHAIRSIVIQNILNLSFSLSVNLPKELNLVKNETFLKFNSGKTIRATYIGTVECRPQ